MWSETGSVLSVVIAIVVTLVICGLLLRNAFQWRDSMVAPSKGWKISWNIIGVLCALIVLGTLRELGKTPENKITVNGLKIPIDGCVQGAVRMFDEKSERIAFCTCLATKLASDEEVASTYKEQLELGQMDKVVESLTQSSMFDVSQLAECMSNSASAHWTDVMLARFKAECLTRMKGDEAEDGHDVEVFCTCLTDKASQYSPSVILEDANDSSQILSKIKEECLEVSKK